MQEIELQVLIVGAGPTGLIMACDLARRGIRFRIIEKASQYFNGSRGKGLQPRSLEVFDDLGIAEETLQHGRFHLPFRAYEGSTVIGEHDRHAGENPTPNRPYASPLIIPQWRVEDILRGLLARSGGHVELCTELTHFTQDDHGITATLEHGDWTETVRCQYLIAADGGRSFVRKFLEVPFEGETWNSERMYVGDVRLRGLDRDAWHSWIKHPDGWLALCPLPSTDTYQLQATTTADKEEPPSLELFQQLVRTRTGRNDIELTDAPWLSLYRPNVRMASHFRMGRVFLAGDSAHVHAPAGGQGMNTGIQDAYNLGWKLSSVLRGAPESLLDTYEEERLPVAANVLGISTKLYRELSLSKEDNMRRDAETHQLGITYRERSLSRHSGDAALKLSSGDRAPDAPGTTAHGTPTRLFYILRGPQFTLLRLGGRGPFVQDHAHLAGIRLVQAVPADPAMAFSDSVYVFVDSNGHLAEAYGGGDGEYLLVRPDGYIGWIGSSSALPELYRYLDEVCPRA